MDWLSMIADFGGKYADYDIAKRTIETKQEADQRTLEAQRAYVAQHAYTDNAMTLESMLPLIIVCVVGFVALRA